MDSFLQDTRYAVRQLTRSRTASSRDRCGDRPSGEFRLARTVRHTRRSACADVVVSRLRGLSRFDERIRIGNRRWTRNGRPSPRV